MGFVRSKIKIVWNSLVCYHTKTQTNGPSKMLVKWCKIKLISLKKTLMKVLVYHKINFFEFVPPFRKSSQNVLWFSLFQNKLIKIIIQVYSQWRMFVSKSMQKRSLSEQKGFDFYLDRKILGITDFIWKGNPNIFSA